MHVIRNSKHLKNDYDTNRTKKLFIDDLNYVKKYFQKY